MTKQVREKLLHKRSKYGA